jgi:hypothetical protein
MLFVKALFPLNNANSAYFCGLLWIWYNYCMKDIHYNIPHTKQEEAADCAQAAAAQILAFYDVHKTVGDIKSEVGVGKDASGKPVGSSVGHLAAYLIGLGFEVTMHTSDIQVFDRSWIDLDVQELIQNIRRRTPQVQHPRYEADLITEVCEGFIVFLEKGGKMDFSVVDEAYLHSLLEQGPIYTVINYQFMFDAPKGQYSKGQDRFITETIKGQPNTHAIVISGYKEGKFSVIDPDKPVEESERWVDASRLVGAYYLADMDIDSILLTLTPK